jgi:hypothetical protein
MAERTPNSTDLSYYARPSSSLASGGNSALPVTLTPADSAKSMSATLRRLPQSDWYQPPPATAKAREPIGAEHLIKADGPRRLAPTPQSPQEQRIAQLERDLQEMMWELRDLRGPYKPVFLAIPNPSDPTQEAQWQEATVNGSNVATFEDGRNCLSGGAPGQIVDPGTSGAFVLLELRTGSNCSYIKIKSGGSLDIYQANTLVLSSSPFLNMSTNYATSNLFEYFAQTLSGVNGVGTRLKAGSIAHGGIYWNGTNWLHDLMRFT